MCIRDSYVSADNRYRSTLSDIYRVNIRKLNEVDGIRTNISDKQDCLLYTSCPINNRQGIVIDGEGSKVICKD